MPDLNASLEALSAEHAAAVSSLTDRASEAIREAYQRIEDGPEAGRYQALRSAILGAVEGARRAARDAAADHMLSALRLVSTASSVPSISIGRDPMPADVLEYVDNAVRAAEEAVSEGQGIASTSWWAERVIESEAFRTYDEARRAAEQSLRALPDDEAERYGFRIAKTKADIGRSVREDPGLIPLLGKRWDAVNDRRTCEQCSRQHGDVGLLGMSFDDGNNPPIHARCRCVTHLWAVGYVKGLNAMSEQDTREHMLARYDTVIEARALDPQARTITGAVASDESLDSHRSVIKAKGWQLERYHRNPILLWQHKSGGFIGAEPEDVLGTAQLYVKGKQLLADLKFSPPGANPKADMVWGQITRGEVRGLSVGFRPIKYHFERADADSKEETMIIDSAELVELSVVMIPSNPNTLIKQVRAMEQACNHPDAKSGNSDAVDQGRNQEQRPTAAERQSSKMDQTTTLPAEVAARLGTDDPQEACRLIAETHLRIEKLEKERDDATRERDEAVEALNKYRNDAADQAVEELIGLGLIKEANRENAQTFARMDLAKFQAMYAEDREKASKREAPKAHLLTQVAEPKIDAKPKAKPIDDFARKHIELMRKLRSENKNMPLEEASVRALQILEAEQGK